jgi:peptidoglycan/LPS O-acetylase OafA/YrhL
MFFIISGFLLTRSLSNGSRLTDFAFNRVLRIVPGFVFCLVAISFFIGPLVTPLTLASYFAQRETYYYVFSSLQCMCDSWEKPFVFASATVGANLNGSLWSLSYEVLSYVFLLWLWVLVSKLVRASLTVSVVAAAAAAAAVLTVISPAILLGIAYTLPYFASGIVMYSVYERFGTNKVGAGLSIGLLCASAAVGLQHYAFAICGAYLVVFLAAHSNIGSQIAKKVGDLSYGIFLFGWPVEQLTQHITGTRSGWLLFTYSLAPAVAAAAISWWVVERPFLALKGQHEILARAARRLVVVGLAPR